jgi:hypothetical protein
LIRQAISCDICGTEKKQTNHWFVAYDQGGELRVSGFNANIRLRPAMKHLCGQTCLHKLVDEYITLARAVRPQAGIAEEAQVVAPAAATDTSLTSNAAYGKAESSAPLPETLALIPPKRPLLRAQPELVTMPGRPQAEEPLLTPGEPPPFASRNWRADAWERERERQMRAVERHPDRTARRRSG